MTAPSAGKFLPAVIGSLHQERAEGVLVLEQNDGCRRLFWWNGDLIYLNSDVAGEQFGNYLLRQGVIDLPALQELLAPGDGPRFGEKVVHWGLLTTEERDEHLKTLMGQILLHALEHGVVDLRWEPCSIGDRLTGDLYFVLHHRQLVWSCFENLRNLKELSDHLYAKTEWRWKAPMELLLTLKDLPLNPQSAYALTFLGPEPITFETFMGLTRLPEEESARLLLALWALGGLELVDGELPFTTRTGPKLPPSKRPEPVASPAPPAPPPVVEPPPPPAVAPAAKPAPPTPRSLPLIPAPTPAGAVYKQPEITIELEHEEEEEKIDFAVGGLLPPRAEPTKGEAGETEHASPIQNARRYFNKAKILVMQERASEAIRALEQSLKLDPDSPQAYDAWLLLGKLRLGNPAWSTRAIEALQAASRLHPKSAEPWAHMGELYLRKGFKANAIGCFRKAIELDPSVPVPPELNLSEQAGDIKEPATLISRLGTGLKAMLKKDKG